MSRNRTIHDRPGDPGKSEYIYVPNGQRFSNLTGSSLLMRYYTCNDTNHAPPPYEDGSLTLFKRDAYPFRVSGTAKASTILHTDYQGYNPANFTGAQYCPMPEPFNTSLWKTKALANANPFNPDVDLPLFLFELRELPGMIRDLGRVLKREIRPSDIPGGNLAYQFGWAPLVSDLGKLLKVGEQFSNRSNYFKKLQEEGYTVQRTLSNSMRREKRPVYELATYGGKVLSIPVTRGYQEKIWYSLRIGWADTYRPSMDKSVLNDAQRASLGLTGFSAATLWNALPWSWLVDYFLNVGDFLEAVRGYDRFWTRDLNLMRKTTTMDYMEEASYNPYDLDIQYGWLRTIGKERSYSPVPLPSLAFKPALTGRQMGILGSLASAKALRSIGR